ncbi:MAG TPA: hypothetical protein VFM68_01540 [Candidatus Saccharimonadales bacterium]|nr:hypothetical protein [Candidatus Saccharimonadales bacterium]
MNYWVKLGIVIGAPVIIVAFIFLYQGSPKEIVAVADQFQSDNSWQLTDERVVSPAIICFEANCPSVHRNWQTDGMLTKEELQTVLNNSGWNFEVEGDCVPEERISGGEGVCGASGTIQQYTVDMHVISYYEDRSRSSVVLLVDKQ